MQRLTNLPIAIRVTAISVVLILVIAGTFTYRSNQLFQQAQQAIQANEPNAADLLAQAAASFPPRPELWQEAGEQALLHDDYETAIAYFERALVEGALNPEGWVAYGTAYQSMGNQQQAIQIWEQAITADNSNVEAHRLLAETYRQQNDNASAIQSLRQLTLLQPGNADVYFELGLLLAASAPEEAITYFVQAADIDANYQANSDLLRRALRDALDTDEPAYAAILTGQALAGVDEWRLAAESFLQAIEYDIEYAEAWAYLGEAKQRLGQGGLEELETALLLNPNSLAANVFLGLYWQRHNQPEQALVYLNTAAELNPDTPSLLVDLGRTTAEAGDLPAALEYFQQATQLSPQVSRYWVALAEFAVDFEVFIEDEGLPAARRALELAPEDPAVLVANGRVAYLLEDQINALRYYDLAILFDPAYTPTYLHLGLLYLTQGNLDEAQSAFFQVVELDPNSAIGQQAQSLLEQYFPE